MELVDADKAQGEEKAEPPEGSMAAPALSQRDGDAAMTLVEEESQQEAPAAGQDPGQREKEDPGQREQEEARSASLERVLREQEEVDYGSDDWELVQAPSQQDVQENINEVRQGLEDKTRENLTAEQDELWTQVRKLENEFWTECAP